MLVLKMLRVVKDCFTRPKRVCVWALAFGRCLLISDDFSCSPVGPEKAIQPSVILSTPLERVPLNESIFPHWIPLLKMSHTKAGSYGLVIFLSSWNLSRCGHGMPIWRLFFQLLGENSICKTILVIYCLSAGWLIMFVCVYSTYISEVGLGAWLKW